jgi:hypothetical protein
MPEIDSGRRFPQCIFIPFGLLPSSPPDRTHQPDFQ